LAPVRELEVLARHRLPGGPVAEDRRSASASFV